MSRILLLPFMILSAGGVLLSLAVHLAALFGFPSPVGGHAGMLSIGSIAVLLPATFAIRRITGEFKQKDFWRAVLRGCPTWMRRLVYGFLAYALVDLVLFILIPSWDRAEPEAVSPAFYYSLSSTWMAFYLAAFGILYSAYRVEEEDHQRRCGNGHPVSPAADFCEECGQQVLDHTGRMDI